MTNSDTSWEKEFDKRYDHYNPENDTGRGIPPWNGADYEDIKTFISRLIEEARAKNYELGYRDGGNNVFADFVPALDNEGLEIPIEDHDTVHTIIPKVVEEARRKERERNDADQKIR
jgi:hypothetical protein